jgi:biopolymer transport protein ExbD
MIRSRARRAGEPPLAEGLTALAAITFILVLFFLVHMNFTVRAGVNLVAPDTAPGVNRADPIVVRVTGAGTVEVKGSTVGLSVLRQAVEEARFKAPGAPLVILCEEGARASLIVRVTDQLKLTGATDIRFSMSQE